MELSKRSPDFDALEPDQRARQLEEWTDTEERKVLKQLKEGTYPKLDPDDPDRYQTARSLGIVLSDDPLDVEMRAQIASRGPTFARTAASRSVAAESDER